MLTPPRAHRLATGLAVVSLVAAGAAGCTGDRTEPIGPFRLMSFDSCADALADLRSATKAAVGPYGLPYGGLDLAGRDGAVPLPPVMVDDRAEAPGAGNGAEPGFAPPVPGPVPTGPDHSDTNVHEEGVQEPDLVKSDGRRIVTISDGRLSVVDVASRRLIGVVDLRGSDDEPGVRYEADLLLAGDHALVFSNDMYAVSDRIGPPPPIVDPVLPGPDVLFPGQPEDTDPVRPIDQPLLGASLLLVDLDTPRILSRARADGFVVDARQVGSTVRMVLRSAPRLDFPTPPAAGSDAERLAANRLIIDTAEIDAWAPRLEVTTGDETVRTQVPCGEISHPIAYSGANLLTVLTFDASRDALGDGSPVSIVADGDTVYSSRTSLYVASNQAWLMVAGELARLAPQEPRTEIYRFDTTGARPQFVGGGSVPGSLLNQYAMSEWEGRLRVATTSVAVAVPNPDGPGSQSGVYVLETAGGRLVQIGAVEGLGKGERIYSVRFVGPVGYVVTFRQTDPLYTVDLRNPAKPVVRGELKIPGYSAYLHPVGDTRLIGIGQDATDTGQVLGTQVSLFDVADLDDPARIAKYTLPDAYSEAEFDPHAFLYWPGSGLLVVPIESRFGVATPVPAEPPTQVDDGQGSPGAPGKPDDIVRGIGVARAIAHPTGSGALVLRIEGDRIIEVGFVAHPTSPVNGYAAPIRRSLVTDGGSTLWTVSGGGLLASDATTLAALAWIPL